MRRGFEAGVAVQVCHDDCVVPPGRLKTAVGKQYAVYSPWFRAWLAHLHAHPHLLHERPPPDKNPAAFTPSFASLFESAAGPVPDLPPSKALTLDEHTRFAALYPAGEAAALDRLALFLEQKVDGYAAERDDPGLNATARVSVHHAAGTLAARTSLRLAREVSGSERLDRGSEGVRKWIAEVAWRDFYRHVLVNWPYVWYASTPHRHPDPLTDGRPQHAQALQVRIHKHSLGA